MPMHQAVKELLDRYERNFNNALTVEPDFTNLYLIRVENTKGKVFGWISGDENAELRKHGIT